MNTYAKMLVGSSLVLSVGMSAAHAGILASGAYKDTVLVDGTEKPLPLTSAGATAVTFSTDLNNELVIVTYHAQCWAAGEPGDYLTVRIAVDGVEAQPRAGADFALCSAVNPGSEVCAGVARQAFIRVPRAGRHKVEVLALALFVSGASSGRVQNATITVQD